MLKEIDHWEKHYKGGYGCVESVYREESICKSIEIAALREYIEQLEAKIDRLMLEYCPEQMIQEQLDNWSNHRICVKEG